MDLIGALQLRRSTREYDLSLEITPEVVSALLWAADGVTGPDDKRTAPSSFSGNQVQVYVLTASGIARYSAPEHALTPIGSQDIRQSICDDEWVGTAPIAFVLTGLRDRFPDFVNAQMAIELLQATAGCIAENLHLMAAALGLGTCMVGHMHNAVVIPALQLQNNEVPLYVMPVGYLRT